MVWSTEFHMWSWDLVPGPVLSLISYVALSKSLSSSGPLVSDLLNRDNKGHPVYLLPRVLGKWKRALKSITHYAILSTQSSVLRKNSLVKCL